MVVKIKMMRTDLNLLSVSFVILQFLLLLNGTTTTKLNVNEQQQQKTATHSFAATDAKFRQPHTSYQYHERHLHPFKALLATVDHLPDTKTFQRSEKLLVQQSNGINHRGRSVREADDNDDGKDDAGGSFGQMVLTLVGWVTRIIGAIWQLFTD